MMAQMPQGLRITCFSRSIITYYTEVFCSERQIIENAGKCMYKTRSNVYLANFVFIIKPSGVSSETIQIAVYSCRRNTCLQNTCLASHQKVLKVWRSRRNYFQSRCSTLKWIVNKKYLFSGSATGDLTINQERLSDTTSSVNDP